MFLPLGTKVVTRVPCKAAGRSYPAGSLGVVLAQPQDANHAYRVRMSDGAEANIARKRLATLSEHQEDGLTPSPASLEGPDAAGRVILRTITGSRAYGLDHAGSDTDVRGVYLAHAERHASLFGVPEQLEDRETDVVLWELQKFLVLALKANPNILEVLYTPLVEEATGLGEELRALRGRLVSRLAFQTYVGYAQAQFKKLVRRVAAGSEPNWKHAMHLLRLLLAGRDLLATGELGVVVPDVHRERLLEVRSGAVAFEHVDAWRQELLGELETADADSPLAQRPDHDAANDFLLHARRRAAEEWLR